MRSAAIDPFQPVGNLLKPTLRATAGKPIRSGSVHSERIRRKAMNKPAQSGAQLALCQFRTPPPHAERDGSERLSGKPIQDSMRITKDSGTTPS